MIPARQPVRDCKARFVPPALVLGLFCLLPWAEAHAAYNGVEPTRIPVEKDTQGVFILDGSFVHNVGQLQLNITNWGLIGSRPSANAPYSDAPSAMWPAGSGVDYLWAAGLWVGAIKNGVPLVSTGQFTPEFLANGDDPLDTIYATKQGEPGGKRFPDPEEDDDKDGLINEDPKNGLDDDGDGKIDEDFAAIGNQHFRAVMRDNTALSQELFPDHDPLDLEVVQQSFQWENETVNDFVGFEFEVTNIGINPLNDVYLGFFADADVGPREGGNISSDDLHGFSRGQIRAKDGSIVPLDVAYMYDCDADNGLTPGYLGILFLGHPTDPTGESAPVEVGITSYQAFSGQAPFDRGGDPTNDAERYELMSRVEVDCLNLGCPIDCGRANDFRIMLSSGPFTPLEPGESLTFQAAIVVGEGLDGMRRNAAEAALTFFGAYFDKDGDRSTGVKGREKRICQSDFGAPGPSNPIFSLFQDCVDSLDFEGDNPPVPIQPDQLDDDGCIFINGDCAFEERRGADDCTLDGDVEESALAGCTGIGGKETNVPWLVGLAPPPPNFKGDGPSSIDARLWEANNRVHLFWNNRPEIIPDIRLQKVDFESYRIWRADGWDRPFGTSVDTGPESKLWRLIAEFDVVDSFELRRPIPGQTQPFIQNLPLGANTGLDVVAYTPRALRPGSPEEARFAPLADLVDRMVTTENDPTFFNVRRKPIVRFRDEFGRVTDLGKKYPELQDWECCVTQIDTLVWNRVGMRFYEYVDRDVHNGIFYFYAITSTDFNADPVGGQLIAIGPGLAGDPQTNFIFASPKSRAQSAQERDKFGQNIYVVPNPATRLALSEFSQLNPNGDDPTGVRIEFRNLPRAHNTVRIFTLAGDLVVELPHDGTGGSGSLSWNLVSRNGQEVVSGIYLYSVESDDSAFERVVGRFVLVR